MRFATLGFGVQPLHGWIETMRLEQKPANPHARLLSSLLAEFLAAHTDGDLVAAGPRLSCLNCKNCGKGEIVNAYPVSGFVYRRRVAATYSGWHSLSLLEVAWDQ